MCVCVSMWVCMCVRVYMCVCSVRGIQYENDMVLIFEVLMHTFLLIC